MLSEISWQSSLIHYQYGKRPSFQALVDRMAPGVPSMYFAPFYAQFYLPLAKFSPFLYSTVSLPHSRLTTCCLTSVFSRAI